MWCPLKRLMAPRNTNRPHFLFSSLERTYLTRFCQIRKAASPGISSLPCVCRKRVGRSPFFWGRSRVHRRYSFTKIVVPSFPALNLKTQPTIALQNAIFTGRKLIAVDFL